MSAKHAILGPSSASKWLTCTPSARLEQQFPNTQGDAAAEGTLAHSLGELIISSRTNAITNKVFRAQLALIETNKFYNKAMYEYADSYAIYVLEAFNAAKVTTSDAQLYIEQKLNMSEFVPEGFGTGDAGVIADGILDIIDLKYGKGVLVDAKDNSQLKVYALGWLSAYDFLYDIHTIRMHIYQPRMNNISVHEIRYADLMAWANLTLRPRAQLAFDGKGDFVAGKHCQFCRAKVTCRANADYQVSIAQEDFKDIADPPETLTKVKPELLTDSQIAAILARASSFKSWVESVTAYALAEALKGRKWPGFKLVEGKSSRKITDPTAVQKALIKDGFDRHKLFKPQEMIALTDIEKLTGKKLFDTLVGPFTIKSPGAPTLADVADKRAEYNNTTTDFADIVDDELG